MIIVLLTICLSFAHAQEICPVLTIAAISAPTICADVVDKATLKYNIQSCAANNVCDFDPTTGLQGTCSVAKVDVAAYPGSPCNPDAAKPCINDGSTCDATKKICSGAIAKDAACTPGDQINCDLGLTCLAKTGSTTEFVCSTPLAAGADCKADRDCSYGVGCLNSKCVAYFSLPNGSDVGENDVVIDEISYCTSGRSSEGKCIDYTPKDGNCVQDPDCLGTVDPTGAPAPTDVCQCTYNGQNKMCKSGTKSDVATQLIASYRNIFATYNKCNADETTAPCNYYHINPPTDVKNVFDDFSLLLWKKENIHRIPGVTDVAQINVFRNVTVSNNYSQIQSTNPDPPGPNPPTPGPSTPATPTTQYTCPTFTCGNADDNKITAPICAVVTQPVKDQFVNSTVVLYDLCNGDEQCGNPASRPDIFFTAGQIKCENLTNPIVSGTRYPGEPCSTNVDCYSNICTGNVCKQAQEDASKCTTHEQCTVGYFCNGTDCVKQLGNGGDCKSFFECQNDMVCLNNKCASAYSQALGAQFNIPAIDEGQIDKNTICVSGRYNEGLKTCVQRRTTAVPDKESKLVTCKIGSQCNYIFYATETSTQQDVIDCECGYNAKGISYCPIGDNDLPDQLTANINARLSALKNKCHTLNRGVCGYANSADLNNTLSTAMRASDQYHLYYGAENCVSNVLNGAFLKISSFVLVVLAALLF